MEKKKNLFRIDTGRTHGWQVRIIRDGERHTKLFSDKKYGGEEAAYEKALAHRNEKLEELPDLPEEGPLQTEEVPPTRSGPILASTGRVRSGGAARAFPS
ncbi:MAG: hypothetical protein BRD30_07480 [Bacteroidetes bacterium QH_2_63_10]|nr:MAG: hypothetical protein BRD30_07480 [Bacteroidetes bacterium QH_2_63_10]